MAGSGFVVKGHLSLLSASQREAVASAVTRAEQRTSAELKVVIRRHGWDRIDRTAARVFHRLELDKTSGRNAVMILLVQANRELLIHGDTAIDTKVDQIFWDETRDVMVEAFRKGDFERGLVAGIERIADVLAEHFPPDDTPKNELSNEVVTDA